MKQEDRDLYLKDLCARLPYHPKAEITFGKIKEIKTFVCKHLFIPPYTSRKPKTYEVKLFLRSMSDMTEEEKKEYIKERDKDKSPSMYDVTYHSVDWLLKNHFDFRGLIPMGLAIEVTKENNPYK